MLTISAVNKIYITVLGLMLIITLIYGLYVFAKYGHKDDKDDLHQDTRDPDNKSGKTKT